MGRHWTDALDRDFSASQPPAWTPAPTINLPRQDTVDLSATVRPLPGHSVLVQVSNVFDAFVYEKAGFPMPGRAIKTTYSYEFR